jgi:hypothetical protein
MFHFIAHFNLNIFSNHLAKFLFTPHHNLNHTTHFTNALHLVPLQLDQRVQSTEARGGYRRRVSVACPTEFDHTEKLD